MVSYSINLYLNLLPGIIKKKRLAPLFYLNGLGLESFYSCQSLFSDSDLVSFCCSLSCFAVTLVDSFISFQNADRFIESVSPDLQRNWIINPYSFLKGF